MTTILSAHHAAVSRTPGTASRFKAYWREFLLRIFDPYRPELHYMRGPGPAWRAKHGDAAAFRLPPPRTS